MKAVLLGSRGHITKPLTKLLVSKGIDTTVITRSSVNAAAIEAEGAKAAVGSIDDTAFLTRTLQGANAVFLLIVADLFRKDTVKHMNQQCHNLCDVVLQANIPNVVYLSSVGADNPKVGFHYGNECILKERLSELPNVSLVRPTGFFTNFFRDIAAIKKDKRVYYNIPKGKVESYVHPADIAQVCADLILDPPMNEKFKINYVESDFARPEDIENMIYDAVDIRINWISISDEAALEGAIKAGIPKENAELLTNLYSGTYHHDMLNDIKNRGSIIGNHKLSDFFKTEFAAEFNK